MKRLIDFLLALALLPVALPILAAAAAAVMLETPGAAFFRQERVGRNLKTFMMLKLRTMRMGTEQRASHEVSADRITRVGRWLRRTKIDELPQLLSVLAGDMSFVGPRPCLPTQTELIAEREARGVFAVRPGITGRAQLAGVDMSTPRRLAEIDAAYVADQSLAGDFALLFGTALGRGAGDAVK